MYVDALPQDMIKWTTIVILSVRCANFSTNKYATWNSI